MLVHCWSTEVGRRIELLYKVLQTSLTTRASDHVSKAYQIRDEASARMKQKHSRKECFVPERFYWTISAVRFFPTEGEYLCFGFHVNVKVIVFDGATAVFTGVYTIAFDGDFNKG